MSSNQEAGLDLKLSVSEMYTPLNGNEKWVHATTRLRSDGIVQFSYTVNGESGHFEGLDVASHHTHAQLTIDKRFIDLYNGSWPVEVRITASTDDLEESTSLYLYDTRKMVADRVDITLSPSDRLQIPAEGALAYASVGSRFYDANNIPLPPDEINWQISLVNPVGGIELQKGLIIVSHMPHSSAVEVHVAGPSGVTGNATLTLYR